MGQEEKLKEQFQTYFAENASGQQTQGGSPKGRCVITTGFDRQTPLLALGDYRKRKTTVEPENYNEMISFMLCQGKSCVPHFPQKVLQRIDEGLNLTYPAPLVVGHRPQYGVVAEGSRFYLISIRICIATYDHIWRTRYAISFSGNEDEVIELAQELFAEEVNNSWRSGIKSCTESEKLSEHGWSKDVVEYFGIADLQELWRDDESHAAYVEGGPATCSVTSHVRQGDSSVEGSVIYFLPLAEPRKPSKPQKSAQSAVSQ